MGLYLQMDGVDDYLHTPPLTANYYEITCYVDKAQWELYRQNPQSINNKTVIGHNQTFIISHTYRNGISQISPCVVNDVTILDSALIPTNQMVVIKATATFKTYNTLVNIFSSPTGTTENLKGYVYDVKIYNDATLVAHYDMSTGTVLDQSGNGNHATLTGGTWAYEKDWSKVLVDHTFTAPDGATVPNANTGQVSEKIVGNWGIENNQLKYVSNGANSSALIAWESNQSDVLLSTEYIHNTATPIPGFGFRIVDGANYWLIRNLNEKFQLYKFSTAGGAQLINESSKILLSSGVKFTLQLKAKGDLIEVFHNGNKVLSHNDSYNISATKHGIRQHTGAGQLYDNFVIESLSDKKYYLSMDGVDDQLRTPPLTFNSIIIDAEIDISSTSTRTGSLVKVGGSYAIQLSSGYELQTENFNLSIDNIAYSWGSNVSAFDDKRAIFKGVPSITLTSLPVKIFSNDSSEWLKGKVYSVKVYNGTSLVAHYDMSTGTVLDRSGNGNHATLTGGTWVEETASEPSVPTVTIISVSRQVISDESGVDRATVRFKFDRDVASWTVNVMGVSSDTGTVADSGGAVSAGTEITAVIDFTELYQEGYNKVNIYGLNETGWTPYEEDPNAPTNYYLSMDGVDDYLQSPNLTYDSVELDMKPYKQSRYSYYLDARPNVDRYFLTEPDNTDSWGWGTWSKVELNETDITGSLWSNAIPSGERNKIRLINETAITSNVRFFTKQILSEYMRADIYGIKFYNGTTLVAHYDMSTGTVQDQSGNNNHATLIGGTWIEN